MRVTKRGEEVGVDESASLHSGTWHPLGRLPEPLDLHGTAAAYMTLEAVRIPHYLVGVGLFLVTINSPRVYLTSIIASNRIRRHRPRQLAGLPDTPQLRSQIPWLRELRVLGVLLTAARMSSAYPPYVL